MPYYIKRTKAKKKDKPLPLFDKAGITIKKKPDLKAKLDKEFSLFIRLRKGYISQCMILTQSGST